MERGRFINMILIDLNNAFSVIYCTPREKLTSSPPFYYFQFKSRQTAEVVEFTAVNISVTDRYQKFIINAAALFVDQREGFWTYEIKPAIANNNSDPGGVVCESGLAYLTTDGPPLHSIYEDQNNGFKTYTK